jgi:hypothetical protein
LRHSLSNSCICVSPDPLRTACGASAAALGANWAYLDVEVLVDFDGVAKEADVLRQIGKLPHVAQPLESARLLERLLCLHLVTGALSSRHDESVPGAARRDNSQAVWLVGECGR